MKQVLMLLVSVLMSSAALAGSEKAVTLLINNVNEHLIDVNEARAATGEKSYCPQINQRQGQYIASLLIYGYSLDRKTVVYKDFSTFTVGELAGAIAAKLYCYPMACPDNKQSTLLGVLCNAKALKMDKNLILETLAKIAGREVNRNEPASNVLGR